MPSIRGRCVLRLTTSHVRMLRIIAGSLKGRKLLAPPGLDTRPMPDRIKQSLFDWLGQDLTDLRVADVCAGSGTIGCEAFSRGACEVHLIEAGRHAQPALLANLRSCGAPAGILLHPRPFQQVLPHLHGLDLIFADPPFPWFDQDREQLATLLTLTRDALAPDGRLVIRGERGQDLPPLPPGLHLRETRSYGRSWISVAVRLHPLPEPGHG